MAVVQAGHHRSGGRHLQPAPSLRRFLIRDGGYRKRDLRFESGSRQERVERTAIACPQPIVRPKVFDVGEDRVGRWIDRGSIWRSSTLYQPAKHWPWTLQGQRLNTDRALVAGDLERLAERGNDRAAHCVLRGSDPGDCRGAEQPVAERLDTRPATVSKWRGRFARTGFSGRSLSPECCGNSRLLCRGTGSSNPPPSRGESCANLHAGGAGPDRA
jgi:hypothetical protein